MATDNKRKLYDALSQEYDMGSYEQFCSDLNDDNKRRKLYDATSKEYDFGSYDSFNGQLGYGPISQAAPTGSSQTGRAEAKQTVTSFKMRRGGRDFSIPVEEVNAAGGLQGWADAHPGAPVRVYMQGKNDDGSDFKGHVDLSQAHERNKTKGYKYQTVETERFKPTDLDKKRMSANLYRSMQQHNAAMQSIKDEQKDVMEYAAKGNGMNFGQAVKSTPRMNPETGEMEDTWLTPDGKRTTSKAAADMESFNYRMATDMSIGGQLRRANERLADIEKRLSERGKELMAEHDKNRPKGLAGFIKEAGQMVIADKVGGAPMQNPEEYAEFTQDKEYQSLRLAMRKAREEIQKLQNAKERETHGERFWHDFGRATGQAIANADAWDFGMGQFRDATTMMQLNKAVESGKELSKAENDALTELYLYDNVQNQYGDLGRGDRWGEIAGSSLSFMKDFLLTGGFSGVGTKIPTAVAKKVAFNAAKKMGADMAGKKVALEIAENGVLSYIRKGGKGAVGRLLASQGKAGLASTMATKAVGVAAEDLLVRAPLMTFGVQGQSTAAKIIETKLGPVSVDENTGELHFVNDKTWGEAAWQAGADQVIENYSEMWGAHIPAMSDVSKFFGARNLTAAVLRATRDNAGTVLSKTNKFLTRAGVNGYVGEVGEEYYGQLWRTMLNLDSAKDSEGNNQFGSRQFHGDIWGGMALSIGMTSAGTVAGSYGVQGAQKGVNSAIYLHHKKNMQRSAKKAASVFDADEWESLQQLIDSQENATMGAFAETVLADPDMTQQQKDATMDYMEKAMTFRGYNLGEMLRGKSGENNPDEQELSQSYMDGYEGTSVQEMVDAANMYQLQYQKLMEAFDSMDEENLNRIMNDIHSDPIAAISKTGEELRPLMLDYANALMVYQGMEQRFNDDMESRIAQAEWETDANTNRQTGQIQPAVMETDGREVYVVNGQIAMLENGNIDTANSDDTIIIRDAETGKLEFANPKVLSSMGESQDPTTLKEQQSAAIRQQLEQEHSDKMNGRLSLEAGSTVSVQRGDGMMSATITGPAVDEQGQPVEGAVTVQTEDGTMETYSIEDLQAWADEANRQRVLDFEDERVAQRSAETASHSEDENASQPVMAMPPFALNDEFTILNPETGEPIHGEVTGELDEDGTVEIYTNMPMNGSLVNRIRPEDLTGMIYTYNGERLEDMRAELTSASDSEQMESQGHTEVYSIPAVGSGKGTDTTEVISGQSKGATAPAGNSSETSDGKVNNSVSEKQENQGESSDSEPTPLQRLPRNEQGEPAFEQAETPELGWDALVEYSEGDSQMAQDVADAMMEGKRKELEKVRKQKPKGKTVPELIASRKKIAAELAQAELEYKQWQDMANVERVRQAAIQAEQEAAEREAAELAAAEEAERKALEKADKRFGEVYDKVKGNALAVERLRQLEPETIYEAASVVLSRGKILWDNKGGSRGFKQETGYGEGERKKMFSMFATKENGGRSLRRLAEDEMQETCSLAGIPYDNVDAFNALTEVISEAQLPSDIRNYIKNRRIEQALEIYDHEQAAEWAAYEEWCYQNFGMSVEEYEAYEEQREEEIRNALGNFDEKEYFSNIADELIERENERRRVEEAVTQRESTGDVGGGEVLSTQGTHTQGGTIKDAERQGVPEGDGNQVVDTTGAVPEGASGGEGVKNNQTRFDRSIPATPEAQRSAIERILDFAKRVKDRVERAVIGGITERQAQDLAQQGIDVDETWVHSFESSAVNHNQKQHGDQRTEDTRGQIAITAEDYDKIPEILDGYDRVLKSSNTTHRSGNEVLIYEKEFDDGYVYYLEEKRDNRKSLAFQTMYKKKKGTDSSDGLMQNASTSTPIATPDNLDSQSESKGNTLLSDKQEVEEESSGNDAKASTSVQQAVEAASAEVNTEPTPAQAEAGNYKKGHVTIGEFDITIENPAGSQRKGVDANGKEWHTTMANAYGYIKGTEGVDGDHIDVFLHSDMDQWNGRKVYVVDQTNTDGSFDEHKVMLGFNDKDEAMTAYLANYDKTWADTHPGVCISETNIENFNKWIESSHRKTKPFAEYSTVSKVVDNAPVRSVHTQDNNKEIIGRSFSPEESVRFLNYMEETADVAPEIELTPANWTKEFGAHGIINTPIGEVKQGDNQYFKLAQKGRNGKLGMIRPTLEHPCVIIEDEREDHDGSHERFSSYIFIKTFAKKDGTRFYHFASITVSKEGKEVVISSQERSANRISKLLQQGKVAWINKEFSLHPMPQIEESVPLNDSNGPTITDNQSAMLGVSSSELDVSSERKVNNSAPEKQEVEAESLENVAKASTLNGTAPHGDKGNAKGKKAPRAGGGKEKVQDQTGRIEDFGEKIAGARKDLLHDMARSIENVTVQSLIELPLSKAFKRPNLKKMVEAGIISDDEALLAEAILQGLIYAKNKPAAARTSRRKREIEEWAKETYTGIRFLGEVLSGDAARKEQALASRKAEMERKVAETNAHIDNLREWNPGKTFDYVTSIPDEVEVLKRVLEGIGHRPGDRVELPLTRVELGRDTKTYTVDSAGKQGAKWFRKYHDSLDSAIDTMILAARLARGDMDVELPQNYMTVRGVGQPHKERTGKFEVLYWSKNGRTVNTKEFSDKQEAEAFAKANSGHVREQVRYINEYDGYMAYAINPLTGNKLPIGREFADRSELQAWIDEQRDEVNVLAVEAIAKESATKGAPREHYYVVASWNKGKMIFSVVDNDKKNPWPIVKDFTTRKEAEQWLEENKERLEAERKMRLEKQKSVVYFNTASERKGADYRDSQPASPGIYDEKFGFRGVQFGNWTNAEDRQMSMDQAYDAFMDLSRQLGLDTRSMSLNGELALAFGARGGGSAAAHYEPMEVVINLTKTQGAGSLAHEWWHALDNFLSRKAGVSLGHATHGNGAENMDPEVSGAISSLAKAVENSEYGKRSTKMGDYWGRHTEMCARLFETWISERIKEQGESSPFLASGLNDNARIVYQKINYFAYRSNERRAAALENREPSVMSEEEFFKTPQSLNGYPYPTVEELKEFAPYLERLFEVLASKERAGGTIAEEPRRRYGGRKQPTVTGRSLFDWADDEEKARRVSDTEPMQATDKGTIDASREADEALDRYAEAYNDYLDRAAAMDSQLETEGVEEELRSDMMAQLEAEETMLYEQKERLEDTLRRFYALNNTPEDAERIARDMVCRMEAEVATQHNRNQILKDILDNAGETTDVKESAGVSDAAVSETEPVKSSVKTGGGYISYEAVGHLPNPLQGEFAYVERLFSRTGEFSFTGRDRIKDRGDVAYLFRNLESYAIENVFAVLVKDGKPTVLHVGMGTATSSMADMMAIRAGVDAFGADKIYLVHNHPSGTMQASIPDRNLMKVLEAAFEGKVSTEGIIIDTTSGRYVTFDGSGNTDVYDRPKSVDADARGANSETAPEVLRLDRTDQSRMPENVTTIRGAQDVKNYLERLRFGNGTKISYLILSHANQVIGNFHTNYTGIDETGLAEEITGMAIKYGGTNVVVYGNMPLAGTGQLQDGIRKHSLGKIALLDVMGVRNGNRESAQDNGLMREGAAPYGMSEIQDPVVSEETGMEEVIYTSKEITPDQQSLLDGRNSRQYPADGEFSERKVNNSASEKQEKQAESSGTGAKASTLNGTAPRQDADESEQKKRDSDDTLWRKGRDRFSAERRAEESAREMARKAAYIQGLAEKLHLDNVEVVTDTTTLEGKRATAKGFYNKRTGKITIVLPNNASTIDAEQTLLHEAVAHYGLRQLFGDRFDTFLDNVFESAEPEIRRKIASMAREHGWNIRTATEEYLAGLAEDTDFEVAKEHAGWWTRIKRLFIDMVEKLGFRGFRDKNGTVLTDNELRYILWRSYENLKERGARGVMGEAADIAMQAELQVGNYAERGIEAEYATMPEDGIADKIEESFNAAVSGELRGKPIEIGVLTKEGRDYLEKLSGMKMKERVSFVLNPSDLVHIYRDHFGNNEKDKGNNIPLTIEDIRSIVDVVANPERIIFGKEPDGLKRNLFYFLAPAKEGTYNLLEIYGDRKGNLTAKTFYKTKKGVSQRVLSLLKSEHLTSVTDGSTLSGAKLPKFFENPTIEEEELFRPGDFTPRDKVLARDQYEKMVSSSRYQFTEAMQDSMLGLKELYRAISGKGKDFRIEDVAGFENAYLYENAMSSRNNSHAHRYFLSYMQPLLKEIGKICGANEQKRRDLMDYMMAKHGLERNEYMRNEATLFNQQLAADKKKGKRLHERSQVTDRDFAGLTGLTGEKDWRTAEATARQWVDDYEAATDTTALWKAVNNATKETLLTIYKSGMISKETHDKIAGMYAHYIPLRGWDETTSDEVYGYLTSKDGPLYGSIMKSAEGRSCKADDPIATIAKMADDAIRQGHRNIMKQRVLNFVLNHPSDLVSVQDLWLEHDDVTDEWIPVFADINDTDTPLEVEQKIEAFEQRMEALKQKDPKKYKRGREANGIPYKVVKGNLREHQVLVKRGGQTMVLTINGNPRAAQAINGLTNPDVGDAGLAEPIFKFMEAVNRQLSAFYTTRNPAFTLSNFIRDMQYANCTMWVKEDARYAKKFHINCCKFNPGKMGYLLHKWENGTLDTSIPIELKFEQFMLNGGETGYTNVKDIESYKRTVAAELKKQGSTARQKWAALGMALDLANRSIENCARFAAFVTSRELGRSIDRSIYDAKEVSVNFNKKGSGAKFAKAKSQTFIGKGAAWLSGFGRALWVFWGAGIQGMTNFGRMARRHPGKFARRVLMRLFLLGVAVPLLNMLFNMLFGDDGDDDKKAYYNLPEYTRRSNICLCFGRTSLTIPLPVEARAIYGLGELAFGAISGNERYSNKELAYQIAAQVSQVLPLDMLEGGGGFQALMPSALKPIAEPYWWNSSYTGMPIYRDTPFNQEDPEWTKAYASTDKHFVGASKWLNEVSGGDDFKKGAIDINPAKLEYMLRGFFGGLFSIPMEGKKTAETIFGDREFEWRSIPILNRVFKSGDERTANRKLREEYFRYMDEYESTGRLVRKYENANDEGVLGYAEKLNFLYHSPEYARWLVFDDFKADMDAYKEMMSDETDPAKQKRIKAEMETEMRELVNALHNPDKYLESIYGKGGYPGIAEEETETE